MKNETKKKITAFAAGLAAISFVFTLCLMAYEHPAQWIMGGVCGAAMVVVLFVGCTIDLDL